MTCKCKRGNDLNYGGDTKILWTHGSQVKIVVVISRRGDHILEELLCDSYYKVCKRFVLRLSVIFISTLVFII